MVKSMTGFGRYEVTEGSRLVTVEIKSVNHRYNEISVRMPRKLGMYENNVRTILKKYANRGKIDVNVSYEDATEGRCSVQYHQETAAEYVRLLQQMADDFGLENDVRVSTLSRFPDVFTVEEQKTDEEALALLLNEAVAKACENFVAARVAEGEHLKKDLTAKCEHLLELLAFIEEREPQVMEEYRAKLTNKVEELLGDTKLDQSILATELTIYADKICVDEETVRLHSHIDSMLKTLEDGENVGRKLDFIAQEMNREANTILSKANDIQITNKAIDLKTEIEKIREQIQNIE